MIVSKIRFRVLISALLVVALTSVFSLRSFAAPELEALEELLQEPTGTLTVKGQVTVNGNSVQSGATVLSGSTIATGSDGNAIIDLGQLGRIEIRDSTTIALTFSAGMVNVRSQCDRTKIEVTRGQVEVRSPKTETLVAGKDETYGSPFEATTAGGTDFTVDCKGRKPVGAFIGPGLLGILALIGAGAAVAIGVGLGDEAGGGGGVVVSPSRP